jgi:hypothetical protein
MQPASKIKLPNVTLISVSGIKIEDALFALAKSSSEIQFAAVKLIGVEKPPVLPEGISFEVAHENLLDSIDAYSHYVLYDLWRHVDTEFCLVVQGDGYVLHPTSWSADFLKYDYIGAPWFLSQNAYIDPFGNHQRVGNGGFSLRSRKLLTTPKRIDIPWDVNSDDFYRHMNAGLFSEDGNICVHNRHLFESDGCVFAPIETASSFSIENRLSEHRGKQPFGFHKHLPSLKWKIRIAREKRHFLGELGNG